MGDNSTTAAQALAILKSWQWAYPDMDGGEWPVSLELSLTINRLAMAGIRRPHDMLLSLLCSGDVQSIGDYSWEKFEGGKRFRLEGAGAAVEVRHWQAVSELIERHGQEIKQMGIPLDDIDLPELGHQDCYPFDMSFEDNRFSVCRRSDCSDVHSPDYFEESYAVRNIKVSLASPDGHSDGVVEGGRGTPGQATNGQVGAPRKWDWDGALLHLAAHAHHSRDSLYRDDGSEPNQSDIATVLGAWFMDTVGDSPSDSHLRKYGRRFEIELNALKIKGANN